MHFLCLLSVCFFNDYPEEADETLNFITDNKEIIDTNLSRLTDDEKVLAISVVAPEISQFSKFLDFLEMRTLFIMYRTSGAANFSVGHFQIKPSFVEEIEKYITSVDYLRNEFNDILPSGSEREKREFRLRQLSSLCGQLKYLAIFIEIVKIKTSGIDFPDVKSKLKYWATLYNAGIELDDRQVKNAQSLKQFPTVQKKYNYSDVSYEFFKELRIRGW